MNRTCLKVKEVVEEDLRVDLEELKVVEGQEGNPKGEGQVRFCEL